MECPDVKNEVPHPSHWHAVTADNIVVAAGTCYGYPTVPYTLRSGEDEDVIVINPSVMGSATIHVKDGHEGYYVFLDLMSDGSLRWRRYDDEAKAEAVKEAAPALYDVVYCHEFETQAASMTNGVYWNRAEDLALSFLYNYPSAIVMVVEQDA